MENEKLTESNEMRGIKGKQRISQKQPNSTKCTKEQELQEIIRLKVNQLTELESTKLTVNNQRNKRKKYTFFTNLLDNTSLGLSIEWFVENMSKTHANAYSGFSLLRQSKFVYFSRAKYFSA